MESFRIESIYIANNCDKKYCKILKTECEYKFYSDNTTENINLYGDNINICALVGKNGSGKSSLLDMLYRILNNFGYLLFREVIMPGAEIPIYLEGIYASIKFKCGDRRFELKCEDKDISLCSNNNKVIWDGTYNSECIKDIETGKVKGVADAFINDNEDNKIINTAKNFFYTIVTNYSIQSLNYDDYEDEGPWIQKLFHKNDGYSQPIVLNPYRHDYGINTETEAELTNYRLSAIFLNSTKKKPFIEGYELNRLEYHFSPLKYYLNIYRDYLKTIQDTKKKEQLKAKSDEQIISFINEEFFKAYREEGSCTNLILKSYFPDLELSKDSSESYKAACVYIIYKVLSSTKYPDYARYYQTFHRFERCIIAEPADSNIKEYINKITTDNTHIANKLQQTIRFIENYESIAGHIGEALNNDKQSFNFNNYFVEKQLPNNISDIIKVLPPPFYKVQIYLNRRQDKENYQDNPILFNKLSSGEKQFAYMMSTYIYHLANLESVPEDMSEVTVQKGNRRVAYRLINMIFDEMELCFHPEYQRTFVNNIVSYIKRTRLNKVFSFNIILTTHSPFILSDIPACNILALENGQPDNSFNNERTFAANIYDILGNNFFMKNFIGEFASKKIDGIIGRLTNRKVITEKEKSIIKPQIGLIGDDVIRVKLLEKLCVSDGIQERIEILESELKKYNNI